MAMSVGDIEAVLRLRDELSPAMRVAVANTLTATNQINTALGSVGPAATRTGEQIVAMGSLTAQALSTAAGKVIAFGQSMVSLAAKYQSLTGVSHFMAQGIGMSAREVDRLSASINKQGITMTGSRDTIIQLVRANLDLSKASQLATVAQSAARLSGGNSSDVLNRLIFGIQTMQPEVLRTSGIIVQLEQEYSKYATTLGKTTATLSGAEKQQATMNAVLREGEKIAGVYAVTNTFLEGKEQSLARYRQDAATAMGESLIPVMLAWVKLQTEFFKVVREYPTVFLALGTAVALYAAKLGLAHIGMLKWITGLWGMVQGAGAAVLTMGTTTRATLAQAAADRVAAVAATQRAMAEAAASKVRNVGFGSRAGGAVQQNAQVLARAANQAVPPLASPGIAASIGAGINYIGTAATGAAAGVGMLGTALAACVSVVGLLAAAWAGWKIGTKVREFQVAGVEIGQYLDILAGYQYQALTQGTEKANAGAMQQLEFARQGNKALAEQAKAAEETKGRIEALGKAIKETPNFLMTQRMGDLTLWLKDLEEAGPKTANTLRGIETVIAKMVEDAKSQHLAPAILKDLEEQLAKIKAQRLDKEISDLGDLASKMNAVKAAGGPDAQQALEILALKVRGFSDEAIAAMPGLKALVEATEKIAATRTPYRKPDSKAEEAVRAELVAGAKKATASDPARQKAWLEGIAQVEGKDLQGAKEKVKSVLDKTDENKWAPEKQGQELNRLGDKARELAKSGREAAKSIKGWISDDEMVKVTATVSSLGGASKMTAEQTLKVGESLAKASKGGQQLAPELQRVADNYNKLAAAKMVADAKGWISDEEITKMQRLYSELDIAALSMEELAKIGAPLAEAVQKGQDLGSQLNGVAAAALNAKAELQAITLGGGLTEEMNRQYQDLEAALGKVKGGIEAMPSAKIKETADQLYTLAAAGMPLSKLDQEVLKANADLAAMSAQGFLSDNELTKLSDTFLRLGNNIPIELLNQSGEALWKMAQAGKLAKENMPAGMTPEQIAALEKQNAVLEEKAKEWARNKVEADAGIGPTAGPNKAIADYAPMFAEMEKQVAGDWSKLGDTALVNLLKGVREKSAGTSGEQQAIGAEMQAKIFAGLSDRGKAVVVFKDLTDSLSSLPDTLNVSGQQAQLLVDNISASGTAAASLVATLRSIPNGPRTSEDILLALNALRAGGPAAEELVATISKISPEAAKIVVEMQRNTSGLQQNVSATTQWGMALQAVGSLADSIGGKFGGMLSVVGNLGSSLQQIENIKPGTKVNTLFGGQADAKTMARINAGAQAVGQVGGMLYKKGGKADNKMVAGMAMEGAAKGAQMGSVAGPYGAAAGAIIGGVLGFMKGSKIKKQCEEAGKVLGTEVSMALNETIQQTAKDLKIDVKAAALLNLSGAMEESKAAAGTFAPQVAALMKGIADGSIPAKEGLEQVGQAFTKIADEAMKAGRVGSREMVALIKQARAMKIDSPEIKAFVGEQLNLALAGVKKFVSAIRVLDEEWVKWLKDSRGDALGADGMKKAEDGIKSLGKTAGVVFGAMFSALAEENGIVSAVDAMSEDFASLKESLSASLGPEMASQILGPFAAAFDTIGNEHLRPLFEGIDGLSQAMKGLANAGYLNVEQFAAMQAGIGTMFDLSIAGGADMKTSLLAVSPAIQAAISAAQEFGIPLDADTQRLKVLAEQNGITFKTDPMRAMLDVMVEIAKVMGATIPDSVKKMQGSFEGAAGAANALGTAVGAVPDYTSTMGGEGADQARENYRAATAAAAAAANSGAGAGGATTLHDEFANMDAAIKAAATEARTASKAAGDSWSESWGDSLKAVTATTEQWKQENTAIFAASGIESATAVQTAFDAAVKASKASGDSNKQASREGRDAAVTAAQDWANANQAAAAQVVASYDSAKAAGRAAAEASLAASKAAGDNKLKAMFDAMKAAKLAEITWEESQASIANAATTTATSITGTFDAAALGIEATAALASDTMEQLTPIADAAIAEAVTGVIDPVALSDQLALVSEEIGGFVSDTEAAAAAAAGIALLETQTAVVAIGTATMDQISVMATSAAAGNAAAGDSLAAALATGAVAVGDLANDPGWADLVLALGSDVPEAAAAAAAAIAAIIANVPGAVNIPVNVIPPGGQPPPPPPPPPDPPEFAGGTQGWRSFSSKGTPVLLHNTEAVIRPGDPVLPGQVGGNTTTVNLSINENPMQTAQTVEQMRRFTLRAAERELSKNLAGLIESGRA